MDANDERAKLDVLICVRLFAFGVGTPSGCAFQSGRATPEPPIASGRSLSFVTPSAIGSTVS